MEQNRVKGLPVIVTALVCAGMLGCAPADRSDEEGSPATAQAVQSERNEVLFEATSPFEDLTEFAVAGDETEMDRTLMTIEEAASTTRSALGPEGADRFDSHVSNIRRGRESGDYRLVALEAVEAYRVLVEGFDETALVVPRAVSLLDYSGFRLQLLAQATDPNWQAIGETASEAASFWAGLEPRIEHKGLRDAMNTTVDGITEAVSSRDVRMLNFAAQVDLDLVDLVEGYFADRAASGTH